MLITVTKVKYYIILSYVLWYILNILANIIKYIYIWKYTAILCTVVFTQAIYYDINLPLPLAVRYL